jgi:transposase-like protein
MAWIHPMTSSLSKTAKQHFWQQHVQQAQLHNGSLADYAKRHGLTANTLYYWIGVLKGKVRVPKTAAAKPVHFSAVRVSSPASAAHYSLQLSLQLTLHCSVLPDPQWLAELNRQMDTET